MLSSLSRQYDRRAWLRGWVRQRWNAARDPERYRSDRDRLSRINALADEMRERSDDALREKVAGWWRAREEGDHLEVEQIIEPAFAVMREVSRRVSGLYHYDEQILAGLAQVRGGVAEMATGEGKTLAITLPALVFALLGRGVHVVTVNSYLAQRDHAFAEPIFNFLGLSVGLLPEGGGNNEDKRAAYGCDITYGVGYEFGFDYLRDQLARMRLPVAGPGEDLRLAILGRERPEPDVCQRDLAFAIIDEVDSVLIDEAGTPLLISEAGSASEDAGRVFHFARDRAGELVEGEDYEVDHSRRRVQLTERGQREAYARASGVPWQLLRRPWTNYLLNALKAEHLFLRDDQYVVEEDKVMIVDEFTGRRFEDRTWREGLHQAVEAKEEVKITPEADSAASITRQRYFALYDTICGLTGTASESAGEFWRFFQMPIGVIPLHLPSRREQLPERIFSESETMFAAIVEDVEERYRRRQPILIGTRTIRVSEALSEKMEAAGIPHRVLNAKQDKEEGEIVALAGEAGSVLIATNMAGRGTHIGLSAEAEAAGGLHVIVVERNESPRIDRQLIGRGARQGQPGSAQSFVSLNDFLVESYAPEMKKTALPPRGKDTGVELPGRFSESFDRLQARVERKRFEARLQLAGHDDWLEETKAALSL